MAPNNKTGAVILGGSILGLLYLGSRGSDQGQEQFFGGGGGGGFFSGQDSNFTDVSKPASNPTSEPSITEAISSFLSPVESTSTSTTSSSGSSKKKTYAPASTSFGVGYFDTSGNMVGGEDNIAKMSFIGSVAPSQNPLFGGSSSKKSSGSFPAGAIGQNMDGSYIYSNPVQSIRSSGGSSSSSSSRSSSSSKKSLKTDSLSGKDKGKGSYTVKRSDGSKVKRYFQ